LATPKLVGTEIAHAVPLTLVAAGHAYGEFRFGIIRTIVRITTRDIYSVAAKFLIYFRECYCWNVILCSTGIYGLVIKVFNSKEGLSLIV
jgi:hypothetical protein